MNAMPRHPKEPAVPIEDIRRFLGEEPETPQEAAERAVESIVRATEAQMRVAIPLLIQGACGRL